jgi:hypothetical protein
LELEQLDVRTTFLHGELEEQLFMTQSEGFIKAFDEGNVCLLKCHFIDWNNLLGNGTKGLTIS